MENLIDKRNYGIDLLKILCMFFIVNLHVVLHGGLMLSVVPLSFKSLVLSIIKSICVCAVNCYGIITGYVYIDSKWKLKNIVNLYLQVLFYSVIILLFMKLFFLNGISFKDTIKCFFPVLTTRYWYFTAYFGMFFLIPYLNIFINKVDCNTLKKLIIVNFILFSILEFIGLGDIFSLENGLSCWWLINLYLIGAYIKRYGISSNNIKYMCMYLVSLIVILLSKFLILSLSDIKLFNGKEEFLFSYSSPFILIMAISLVMFFKNLKFNSKVQRIISFIVSYSFGVYLIHDNSLVRGLLISNRFTFLLNLNPLFLFLSVPLISFIIFMVCVLIDYMRAYIFKILKISKLVDFLVFVINKVLDDIIKFFNFIIE